MSMGVYIKGMAMPRSCNECRFAVNGWCYAYPNQANGDALNKRERANFCPLVPVPPHGRLIEKNAVFELIRSFPNVDRQLPVEFMKALYELPTIIPADPAEEVET
jgi:hypothetical protein